MIQPSMRDVLEVLASQGCADCTLSYNISRDHMEIHNNQYSCTQDALLCRLWDIPHLQYLTAVSTFIKARAPHAAWLL
jgi:hypothetical protein